MWSAGCEQLVVMFACWTAMRACDASCDCNVRTVMSIGFAPLARAAVGVAVCSARSCMIRLSQVGGTRQAAYRGSRPPLTVALRCSGMSGNTW